MTRGPASAIRSSDSSTSGRIASPFTGSSWSIITVLIVARMPESTTARATSTPCQYMSRNFVVPERIISTQASRVPQ